MEVISAVMDHKTAFYPGYSCSASHKTELRHEADSHHQRLNDLIKTKHTKSKLDLSQIMR